jgi:ABC-type transport system involved in cytochrome bd biosynthesis fused ATPase/permease subunit
MKNKLVNNSGEKLLRCSHFLILYHYLCTNKPVSKAELIGVAVFFALSRQATKLGIPLSLTLTAGLLAKKAITYFFAGNNEPQQNLERDQLQQNYTLT